MNRMRRVVVWKLCLFLGMLCLWPGVSQAAECRNQIQIVGGSTAILRGRVIDKVEELREVMKNKKYREAYRQILIKSKLWDRDRSEDVLKVIEGLEQKDFDAVSYDRGTKFEWMSFRHKSDKTIGLLWNSCWDGKDELKAWTFTFENHVFIIPATCLNLALLREPPNGGPPVCELEATPECLYSPSKSRITVAATTGPAGTIKQVDFTAILPNNQQETYTDNEPPFVWNLDATYDGTYSFKAVAYGTKEKAECKTKAAVCVKEVPKYVEPCTPPSCSLKVQSEWSKEKDSGILKISAKHPGTDDFSLTLKKEPDGKEEKTSEEVENLQQGEYTVKLVANPKDQQNCKAAVCSTTVNLQPPQKEKLPCCVSPWLLRAFGGWVEGQGSDVNDWIMTADGEKGDFKFDFNQGLGFGLELERLLIRKGEKWSDANWGWTFSLFQADLDTRWIFDTPRHWIMDDDRVPMLALTTGLNYHWWHEKDKDRYWGFYAGPVVGLVSFEDGSYADGTMKPGTFNATFDDSFAYGARAGFDAFLGDCWGITGGVEYLKVTTEADFAGRIRDVHVNPLILKAGFVYHF